MESHVSEELFKTYQKKKKLKNIKKKSKIKKYLNFHKKHVIRTEHVCKREIMLYMVFFGKTSTVIIQSSSCIFLFFS